jgi:glycine cleavage system H protein
MNIPEGLRYTRDHEWVRVEDGTVRMGISDYAQHELGDVVFVEIKPAGTQLQAGDTVGTVESVKAVSDVYAPVACTLTGVNAELEASPELVNSDCYGRGWMAVLTLASALDLDALMDAAAYRAYLEQEAK